MALKKDQLKIPHTIVKSAMELQCAERDKPVTAPLAREIYRPGDF